MEQNIQLLQARLSTILQNNVTKKFRLSTTWQIAPSRLAHSQTSELLFKEAIPNTWKKYKCSILIDVSWSMLWNGRIRWAIQSAQNLVRLFYWLVDFNIICFWATFYTISVNKLLSADTSKSIDYLLNFFNWRARVITLNWKKDFIKMEGWDYDTAYWTRWIWAIWMAYNMLKNEDGEKFIVYLTDWQDLMDDFERARSWEDLWEHIDKINWIDIRDWSPERHRLKVKEIREEWINILPIWINTWLWQYYDEYVEISDAWDVFEHTLRFMEKNFK